MHAHRKAALKACCADNRQKKDSPRQPKPQEGFAKAKPANEGTVGLSFQVRESGM
jgi:hypothetical protein